MENQSNNNRGIIDINLDKNNQTNDIINMINQEVDKIFIDDYKEPWVLVEIEGEKQIKPINKDNNDWILFKYVFNNGKTPSQNSLNRAINTMRAIAKFKGEEQKLNIRVARCGDSIYYDLCNHKFQKICIKPGEWKIIGNENSPVLFKRYKMMDKQVYPTETGDAKELLNFINLNKDSPEAMMLLIYIAACFIPDIPHPIIHINGEKGSAKSNLSKFIKKIIDPSRPELLTKTNNELIQNLAHNWFAFFDNVSNISKKESDIFCRASTGAGVSKRMLFSDDDDFIYSFKHCVGINGIDYTIPNSDLMDRSIIIELPVISPGQRITEQNLYSDFERKRPIIFTGFLDIIAEAMIIKQDLQIDYLPRMADFYEWGMAFAIALGYSKDFYIHNYKSIVSSQLENFYSPSNFELAIKLYIQENGSFEGSATELLSLLRKYAQEKGIDDSDFPSKPNWVTRKIKSSVNYFYDMNIDVMTGKKDKDHRVIKLLG